MPFLYNLEVLRAVLQAASWIAGSGSPKIGESQELFVCFNIWKENSLFS